MTQSLKSQIKSASFPQWKIADQIGISEKTLIVWLRREDKLPSDKKDKIIQAIGEFNDELKGLGNGRH